MKHFHHGLASLLVFALACGGGSASTPAASSPGQTAPTKDDSASANETEPEPGMGDEDRIPDKPKPFISVGRLMSSNQAAGAPVKSVPAADAEKAIARVIEMFVALADGMTKSGDDCNALAAAIRTWTATYAAELRQMMPTLVALDEHMTPEREKAIEKELAPVGQSIETSIKKCSENQAVMAAFMELATAVQEEPNKDVDDNAKASD